MDIRVDKLRQYLQLVGGAIPKGKVTLPITTSVLFSEGKLTAANLEYWISVEVPEIDRRTNFVLSYQALNEALRFIPGSDMIGITSQRNQVVLETPNSTMTLNKAGQPRDFPPMPQLEGEGFRIDGDRLVKGLMQVHPYVAKESTRAVLMGVAMKLADPMELVATDGWLLGLATPGIQLEGEGTGHMPILAGDAVRALDGLWRRAPKPPDFDAGRVAGELANAGSIDIGRLAVAKRLIHMIEDGNHMSLTFGIVSLCSILIQGDYVNYMALMPDIEGGRQVSANAEELLRAVNQVGRIARGGSDMVRLRWTEDRILVAASDTDVGNVEVTVTPAVIEGGDARTSFNVVRLKRYLSGKEGVVTLAAPAGEDEVIRGLVTCIHRGSPKVLMMAMNVTDPVEQPPVADETPATEDDSDENGRPEGQSSEPAESTETTPPRARRQRRRQPKAEDQD